MKKIYKYKLTASGTTGISDPVQMPKSAQILSVAFQESDLCIWAEIDTEEEEDGFFFEVFATGENMYQNMGVERKFIGTTFICGLVFHVYHRLN